MKKICPVCTTEYPDTALICTQDNARLSLQDPYGLIGSQIEHVIDGKYRLERVVGRGGMAVIYCAHQMAMNRQVALKIPLQQFASDERFADIFEHEIRHVGQLHHPNVVVIYDCGRTKIGTLSEVPYMVMEWMEGITLEQKISKGVPNNPTEPPETVPLSLAETANILRQVGAALYAAHQKKIIHRDVKPSNIMVVQDSSKYEHIKMLDFGISKAITGVDFTYVTQVCGTPYYASPEQRLSGSEIDLTSDIYSLGVMLYQLITGRLPFHDSSLEGLTRKHREDTPPKISDLCPEAIVVEKLLLQMLDKSREKRPRNVMQIADAFDTAIKPVRLQGRVVWNSGNPNRDRPISGAVISLHQDRIPDQVSDDDGYFTFDEVLNVQPFRVSVQADYFESGDYEIKSEKPQLIRLPPKTVELGGSVFTQVTKGGDSPLRKLGNTELLMEPLGLPPRGDLMTKTDAEGRFKIRLVGPQLTCVGTPYTINIEGYEPATLILTSSEMHIIVKPVAAEDDTPDEAEKITCPKCGRTYKDELPPKFCFRCGTQLYD